MKYISDETRENVAVLLGIITGNIGDEDDRRPYKNLKLTKDELDTLSTLYDFFADKFSFKKISTSQIDVDELKALLKVFDYSKENDLGEFSL